MWTPSSIDKRRAALALHHAGEMADYGAADILRLKAIVVGKRTPGAKADFDASVERVYRAIQDYLGDE